MSDEHLTEKTIESKEIYSGKIVRLCTDRALLPNGKTAAREVVYHQQGMCVAAVDELERVYMVRQYRYPMGEVVLELPAGKLETREQPDNAILRELREEAGITAAELKKLAVSYPSPGFCTEVLHLYVATGLSPATAVPDEDEFLDVVLLPLEQAVQMVYSGEIKDAKTQTLLLLAQHYINKKSR